MTSVEWTGLDSMFQQMDNYVKKVEYALVQVATYFKAVFETYAKQNHPWTDRTANATQTLHGWVNELSRDTVELYLSHGVEYGVYLETIGAGRWAVIWPTIQAHLQAINDMLKGIFG